MKYFHAVIYSLNEIFSHLSLSKQNHKWIIKENCYDVLFFLLFMESRRGAIRNSFASFNDL